MMAHIIDQYTQAIAPLHEMGEKMITCLGKGLADEFKASFKVVEASETTLLVSYFGYKILFRFEILLVYESEKGSAYPDGRFCAYHLGYNLLGTRQIEEICLGHCSFDKHGNVTLRLESREMRVTCNDYASWFLAFIFENALKIRPGMTLRP